MRPPWHRDLTALQPAKPAVVKPNPHAQDSKRSWLGKLTQNKADTLSQMADKLSQGQYLEPMSHERVGAKVESSMGEQFEQFATFQGAVHDIMQQGRV